MKFSRNIFIKCLLASISVCAFYIFSTPVPDSNLHLYFIDVGQGDAILVKSPGGKRILVDSGEGTDIVTALSEIGSPMNKQIDLIITTHPHEDHIGGFLYLKDYFRFSHVIQLPVEYQSEIYSDWWDFLESKSIIPSYVVRGDQIRIGKDLFLKILWPRDLESLSEYSINDTSIVMMLEYYNLKVLFMGDAESEVEDFLVQYEDLDSVILKVGHHGSDSSSSESFLAEVAPDIAIISVGEENSFGHPSDDVIKSLEGSGAIIYRTDLDGTIEIVSDGEFYWLQE